MTVIAVTGKVMAGERMRCMDAGANDYVPKPVDANELFAALRPWLPQDRTELLCRPARAEASSAWHPRPGSRTARDHRRATRLDGWRVLVVDDDYRNIFAMTAVLERGNAIVTVAESGAEAIAALELDARHRHRADGHHDAGDGRLRDHPRHPAIERFTALPIIAVTGKVAAGERQRCLDAGADDYVPKPVDTAALLAALAPWLPTAAHAA